MIKVDGNKIAQDILKGLKKDITKKLDLAIIQIGDSPVSASFIKKKQQTAKKIGINCRVFQFEESISNRQLRKRLAIISKNDRIHGVLIQLPLPEHLNTQYILDSIPLKKDIDVLASNTLGKYYTGKSKILPPVVEAVLQLLKDYDIKVASREVVLVGNGRLVGKPLSIELKRQQATVTALNSKTPDISKFTKEADILISGVGKPDLINASMIKKDAFVIDAGLSSNPNKKLQGDIKIKDLNKKAKVFVPARGGIGPITVAMVMKNLIKLNKN